MRWILILCAAALVNNASGQSQNLAWELNSPIIDLTVGPTTAVHCRLTSPSGAVTFDDFGPCKVNIDRVNIQHYGTWTVSAIQQNNVLPVEDQFHVQLTSSSTDSKPTVTATVMREKPLIQLTCSMVNTQAVIACVFRDPAGRLLQARQGVSEDRYSFFESSIAGIQSCGLEINGTLTSDLGRWRCDIRTATETYYGHLSVLCPWAMMNPEIAASVISVPTLISQTHDQVVVEGDSVTMSCSIQSAIRYCYFRARNETIFNVRPERISVSQITEGRQMVVQGVVHGQPTLDYCRFVRIDGVGFTSENVPSGYSDSSSLSQGLCKIFVAAPTILDDHAWTVVAKVRGQEEELTRKTEWNIGPPPPGGRSKWWLYVFVIPSIVMAILLVVFSFKRNRRWATETATGLRNNIRTAPSLEQKAPLPA